MARLSVVIPSRDERFLVPTIRDIFLHAKGEIEVVAVLDSDKWPEDWQNMAAKYPNLHTIHNGKSVGMRGSINRGVASAKSRGAKFIMKTDGHCSFSEGFDEVLKKDIEKDWVVVPRRGRLDPENWIATDTHKPDIDYHYLSFPDDPKDFGGAGLNGKVWEQRARERKDILIDEEMSSQGSCWFMHTDYFYQLELMDDANYGPFWNEMQEVANKCWLSGGQVMVNKNAKYLHLHKGKKYGRGYRLAESALKQGRNYSMKWLYNEAWAKQTLPFKTLIERFWPVPSWPENWEELVYVGKVGGVWQPNVAISVPSVADTNSDTNRGTVQSLVIHTAHYGIDDHNDLDVTTRIQSLIKDNTLDIGISNAVIVPGENPWRGKQKRLKVTYSYDGGEQVTVVRDERDALIIGQAKTNLYHAVRQVEARGEKVTDSFGTEIHPSNVSHVVATSMNDFLIRKFSITSQRLRAPMPVELRDFDRNDLAKLFAELEFTKGVEVGVAEGHYSEVLCKTVPNIELTLVDPWTRYSDNPRAHSQEHQQFSLNETKRKTTGYNVHIVHDYSMNAVRDVPMKSLDWAYIDGHHSFDYCLPDLIEWSKRVRSGGIVAGDDYFEMKWGGVIEAVQAYVKAHDIRLWFTCQAPKSYDFFWVNP